MSFDRTNPDHCPTCDTTEPCVHRATRPAHVAFREGRDAYEIPWANGEAVPEASKLDPYPAGSDDSCWFIRGYQAGERREMIASMWADRATRTAAETELAAVKQSLATQLQVTVTARQAVSGVVVELNRAQAALAEAKKALLACDRIGWAKAADPAPIRGPR